MVEAIMVQYEVLVTEYYTPANGGRPYSSERVVQVFGDKHEAETTTNQYNRRAVSGQHYSFRKVEN
jgi:hypothetical protein